MKFKIDSKFEPDIQSKLLEINENKEHLGIENISITNTSLEDVFLQY
jgi:hypothetical protein